ncbi:MAG: 16S rRNA (guanine(966)-N(2))-methyltransferase RsmD [Phycisphaerales bacterium]|nr:16S rRNA (guanine(966)-N(2))-methyltransferase RsmD [Phycisphaerales bacterium]
MRIIAGEFRSRKLISPAQGATTRPIPDRVKESVFSLLRGHFEDAAVLDLFAGTGSIGLEAVSRGAARCVMIEKDKRAAATLHENVELLGAGDRCEVVQGDVLGMAALARCPRPVNLIFCDPPYTMVRERAGWARVRDQFARFIQMLADDGFAIIRTPCPFTHAIHEESRPVLPDRDGKPGRVEHLRVREDNRLSGAGDDEEEVRLEDADEADFTDELTPDEIDAAFDETGHDTDPDNDDQSDADNDPTSEPGEPVDLSIQGTVGPETHIYGSTAVHLYMKRRPA